jgi:hypothetical protein
MFRTIDALWKRKRWVLPNLWSLPFQKRIGALSQGSIHVLFLLVDHFEPFYGNVYPERQLERVEQWRRRYPETVQGFQDCQGRSPQYTWFYFGEEEGHLKNLSELCFLGLGEIEMHIHHGPEDWIPFYWKKWTRDGFRDLIEKQKGLFSEYGALITAEEHPQRTFGFIHGMFALDNSFWEDCGLKGELELLRSLGCYGDFTFPAPGRTQPPLINCLFYPQGDPSQGPSYFKGEVLKKGTLPKERLLIFQGPIGYLRKGLHFSFEDGLLAAGQPLTRERVDFWISRHIHVPGRPDWIFVKLYTHGTQEGNLDYLLGEPMVRLHSLLQETCGPSSPYSLHYVSAREAYNIAMAAAAGKEGDPGGYRDYIIPPYANRYISSTLPYRLEGYSPKTWALTLIHPGKTALQVKGDVPLDLWADCLVRCRLDLEEGKKLTLHITGQDQVEGRITLPQTFRLSSSPQVPEGTFEILGWDGESQMIFKGLCSSQGGLTVVWTPRESQARG